MSGVFPERVPVASLADLRGAVATAADLRRKREARAELDAVVPAAVGAGLAAVAGDVARLEAACRDAIADRAGAEKDWRDNSGDAEVALPVERKATIEFEMAETARLFLRLSLGHRLDEEAIRRDRDRHRGGMMQATETILAQLTNGAHARLQTRTAKGTVTRSALGAGGMAKQVHDLSKGTRFRLYLALRAAAYERLAGQGMRLPFFCDDILRPSTRPACGRPAGRWNGSA